MVVLVLEKVPTSLRGELTRWMAEIQTGVFVGTMSALVRDLLWDKCVAKLEEGELTLEESLKLFEEGTKLSKSCGKQLNQAQRKVEMLVKKENDELEEVPFSVEEEENGQ